MTDNLLHAYTPLILWMSLGLFIFRFLPQWLPRFLGRGLYWVGVPLELFALARQSQLGQFNSGVSLPLLAPVVTIGALVLGLIVAFLVLWGWKRLLSYNSRVNDGAVLEDKVSYFPMSSQTRVPVSSFYSLDSNTQGSFILATVLGNTGFVGLGIAPFLINSDALGWAVLYSITHNLVGPYGMGVVIASYFSQSKPSTRWWMQLREILSVPPLWAFIIGILTQQVQLPQVIESGLQGSVSIVIACAFLLTGIRLGQLRGWKSIKLAVLPAAIKVGVTPLFVGLATTLLLGLSGDRRLAMVLMSGMPSAFAGLILAEEYNLDRDLIASSIILSTLLLLLMLPLWIVVFG
ncbi:AEC family transporter [Fischerella sp. PCC 9605]|uniref:AEC family transporter n=1 Tax=Fischerella sp. PCC 9605 TaxID=1173024 RepID=UPI00047CC6DC|nr:AEC family transporter [Fischerella sp. PCC 9605]